MSNITKHNVVARFKEENTNKLKKKTELYKNILSQE